MNILNYGNLLTALEIAGYDGSVIDVTITKEVIHIEVSSMSVRGLKMIIDHFSPEESTYISDLDTDCATDVTLVFEWDEIKDRMVV